MRDAGPRPRRSRRLAGLALVVGAGLSVGWIASQAPAPEDPLAFFHPWLRLSTGDRRAIDRGDVLVRVLPGHDSDVAIFGVLPVHVGGDRLIAWVRNIAELKKSSFVLSIGRFSEPPRLEDLAGLALEEAELEAIRECRPGACDVKLTAGEIERLHAASAGAQADWKPRLQDAFRRLVLERVRTYIAHGHAALAPYADHDEAASLQAVFSSLVQRSPYLIDRLPRFAEYLDRYPDAPMPGVESFVYWSNEQFAGKPVLSATHVSILRNGDGVLPDTLVAGKQIFATHYTNGALSLTAIMRGGSASHNYLVYLNRSEVDVIGGFFRDLARGLIERRLVREAADVLQGLGRRLESGEPPP